jgi:ATP-dependent Lhr-like helicase
MTRWRWNCTRSLALLRFSQGRRVAPQIQRMRAEDLLSAVFPQATACQDNQVGTITVPDHPLVRETMRDCLTEALDVEGLIELLERIEHDDIQYLAVETPMPSAFAHEILNASPYAYLDDAPLEERRARAVQMRRMLPAELADRLGGLDAAAIAQVAQEAWPGVRDADELHDALLTLVWVPQDQAPEDWGQHVPALIETGRAFTVHVADQQDGPVPVWVATERKDHADALLAKQLGAPHQGMSDSPGLEPSDAVTAVVQGWMESIGPTTATGLARRLRVSREDVVAALLRLETAGQVLRGQFTANVERGAEGSEPEQEWCDRRLLARIHRLTTASLRREIEPVPASDFMRFLLQWQHVTPGSQLHGETGLLQVLRQLSGFEAAGPAWERQVLSTRVANYKPEMLDRLCLGGQIAWGRLSPPNGRLINLTSAAPISLFPREDAVWLLAASTAPPPLSPIAQDLYQYLMTRGASFFNDLVRGTQHLPAEVEQGLWELVAAGLITADGFDSLRALLDPRRRRAQGRERARRPRHSIGRWSLLIPSSLGVEPPLRAGSPEVVERVGQQLLRRYGIVFRDLLARESSAPPWRDLLVLYRRMELRGEIRGGRFVTGFTGEQFGLPEAVAGLRAVRRGHGQESQEIRIGASDPLNLVGILLPGARLPAGGSGVLVLRDGLPVDVNMEAPLTAAEAGT